MNAHPTNQTTFRFFLNSVWERSRALFCPKQHHQSRRFAVLGLLLLALTACFPNNGRDQRAASVAEPTPVPTAVIPNKPVYTVTLGDVLYSENFNGRVAPVSETPLYFPLSGQVAELFVERGQPISQDTPIARLDTSELENELLITQSALDVAQSKLTAVESNNIAQRSRAELNLALAQLELQFAIDQASQPPTAVQAHNIARLTILRDLAQLDVNELNLTVDPELQAEVQQIQLRINELQLAIDNATLLAPTDGVLLSLNLAVGRSVAPQEVIGSIANLDDLEISLNIANSQMATLTEGMPVTISLSNTPGQTYSGYIRQMPYPYGTRGSSDLPPSDTSTRITFDNAEDAQRFQPGDRMLVSVVIEEQLDTLWLPLAAIREFSGRQFVVVEDALGQSRVDIELGIQGNGRVQILEGLSEGQTVIGQ